MGNEVNSVAKAIESWSNSAKSLHRAIVNFQKSRSHLDKIAIEKDTPHLFNLIGLFECSSLDEIKEDINDECQRSGIANTTLLALSEVVAAE